MPDKDQDKEHLGKKIDKLIMGAIIGGAIGSVLGMSLAPKKGKETRDLLKEKGKELVEKSKKASENFVKDHRETFQSVAYKVKQHKGGVFKRMIGLGKFLLGKKGKKEKQLTFPMKEIPDEWDKKD